MSAPARCTASIAVSGAAGDHRDECNRPAGHYGGPTPERPDRGRRGSAAIGWHSDGQRVWADTAEGARPHVETATNPGSTPDAPLDAWGLLCQLGDVINHRAGSTPVVLWVDGNPREAVRLEYDEDLRALFVHARREVGWGDRLTAVDHDRLAPDDHRRHNASTVRGALAWALYASATGDEEGGSWEAARDALGHDIARELERVLARAGEGE